MDINNSLVSRFYSQIILEDFSIQDQENLLKKEITIIGCGGLGSPVSVYLAASGVGRINLVDPDVVEIRNLHRQVFFQEEDIGEFKVDVLKDHIERLNSHCKVNTFKSKSWEINFNEYSSEMIFDCSDNFRTKYSLNEACVNNNVPFCNASVSDSDGQIALFANKVDSHCCYNCLFPENGDIDANDCAEAGVLGPTVSLVASLQALIGLKYLLNKFNDTETIFRVCSKKISIEKNKILSNSSCRLNKL